VRQGDNLSPSLFKIYINDIVKDLNNHPNTHPVEIANYKLSCLLYADDIVLLSSSKDGLQQCINSIKQFTNKWNLSINTEKTKVVIFNKEGKHIHKKFTCGENTIECTNSNTYLGIQFGNSGSFKEAISILYNKGLKAMHKLNKLLNNDFNTQIALQVFDSTIAPILLSQIELKFYRRLIRGELGRHPITLTAILNSIKYFIKTQSTKQDKLVYLALQASKAIQHKSAWYTKMQKIMAELKINPNTVLHTKQIGIRFAKNIEHKLKTAYEKHWQTQLHSETSVSANKGGNKLRTYRPLYQVLVLKNTSKELINCSIKLQWPKYASAHTP